MLGKYQIFGCIIDTVIKDAYEESDFNISQSQ